MGTLPLPLSTGLADNFGVVRIASGETLDGENSVFYRDSADDKWDKLLFENFQGKNIIPLNFSKDNESIYLSANVKKGT